jgi:CRISPR-associated protein Cmr2
MNNNYTIFTVGPIYETLKAADKTRALWAASVLFSWVVNRTLYYLIDKDLQDKIIVPYIKDKNFLDTRHDAGLLHDRIILKGGYADAMKEAFEQAVKDTVEKIKIGLQAKKFYYDTLEPLTTQEIAEAEAYFKTYFQYHIIQTDDIETNPVLSLSPIADAAEYQVRLAKHIDKRYLYNYFDRINRTPLKSVIHEKTWDMTEDRRFRSTLEIAAAEFIEQWKIQNSKEGKASRWHDFFGDYDYKDDDEVFSAIKEDFGDAFKHTHKHYAIVVSDGDGVGTFLKSIGDDEDALKRFSQNLFGYLKDAVTYIRDQGGMVIYAGGDDLLFFIPVLHGNTTLFDVIKNLDSIFKKHLDVKKETRYEPLSLSYGVAVNHYKFPLYEALQSAWEQLFGVAKKAKWANGHAKNTLALRIRKHAGAKTDLIVDKSTQAYENFLRLVSEELNPNSAHALPHSFQHKLKSFAVKFDDKETTEEKIDNFFNNQFDLKNDDISAGKKIALESVREILKLVRFNQECVLADAKEAGCVDVPFAMLQAVKLLRGDTQ